MAGKKNQAAQTAEMLAAVAGGATVSGPDTAKADGGGKALAGETSADTAAVSGAVGTDSGTTQTGEGHSMVVGDGAALTLPPLGIPGVAVSGDVSAAAVAAVREAWGREFVTKADGSFVSDAEVATPATPAPAPVPRSLLARVLVEGRFGKVNDVVRVGEDELQAAAGELCGHPASVAYARSL